MEESFAAIIGTVLGFFLSIIPSHYAGKRKIAGCKESLKAEIKFCSKNANIYMKDGVVAPLYRLPVMAWENTYPVLLTEGALNEVQVAHIHAFYSAVQTFNRGLDQANVARYIDEETLRHEFERLILKAEKIIPSSELYLNAINGLA